MLVQTKKAKPGYSLFSFNLQTKEAKFVSKQEFTLQELKDGVEKFYPFVSGLGTIYLQELDLKSATKKFKKFVRHKTGKPA